MTDNQDKDNHSKEYPEEDVVVPDTQSTTTFSNFCFVLSTKQLPKQTINQLSKPQLIQCYEDGAVSSLSLTVYYFVIITLLLCY
jgi:hypothetical protein